MNFAVDLGVVADFDWRMLWLLAVNLAPLGLDWRGHYWSECCLSERSFAAAAFARRS